MGPNDRSAAGGPNRGNTVIGNLAASLLLAVATGTTALPAAAGPPLPDEGVPIASQAYRDDLIAAAYENGRLPAELLIALESNPNCLLEEEAAEAWLKLERQAAADGVEFTASWCYRDMKTQRRTYRRNCPWVQVTPPETSQPETPVGSDDPADSDPTAASTGAPENPAAPLDPGDEDAGDGPEVGNGPQEPEPVARVRACRVPTARPGNSNHGWGRAIDLTADGALLTCESEAFQWLLANAPFYGWVHPEWAACGAPKQEAWHWEWGGVRELKAPSAALAILPE